MLNSFNINLNKFINFSIYFKLYIILHHFFVLIISLNFNYALILFIYLYLYDLIYLS